MANYSFGDIDEIVCQHTLGEFRFKPKANEDSTYKEGGIIANDDDSQITSDGTLMTQLNRERGTFESVVAVDNATTELKNSNKLSAHPDEGTWTVSFLNGIIIKGKGRPVGAKEYSSNAGTMTLKIAVGKWETIS